MKIVHSSLGSTEGPFHEIRGQLEFEKRFEENPAIEAIIRDGVILTDGGAELSDSIQKRLRGRLLETYGYRFTSLDDHHDRSDDGFQRPTSGRRMLIHDLWPWGTIPMLGGNAKAGKTTVVLDLARALVIPGYRFLDQFGPSTLTEDDLRKGGVVLINAETPPDDFEAELDLEHADGDGPRGFVLVEHLEELGGAHIMDLTDPAIYDMWLLRLSWCDVCDGSDEWVPNVVIVDGVTAILLAAGKSIEAVGLWFASFRRLMRELRVPSALAVGHNTMQGAHLMGGTEAQAGPDGLWTYSSDNADDGNSKRRFSVRPRTGGVLVPPTRVLLDMSGRPVIRQSAGSALTPSAMAPDRVDELARQTADYVRENPGADGQRLSDHISPESKPMSLQARSRALDLGLIREEKCSATCSLCDRPHHRRSHYWTPEADQ